MRSTKEKKLWLKCRNLKHEPASLIVKGGNFCITNPYPQPLASQLTWLPCGSWKVIWEHIFYSQAAATHTHPLGKRASNSTDFLNNRSEMKIWFCCATQPLWESSASHKRHSRSPEGNRVSLLLAFPQMPGPALVDLGPIQAFLQGWETESRRFSPAALWCYQQPSLLT